jgi:hypothetical protein
MKKLAQEYKEKIRDQMKKDPVTDDIKEYI